MIKQFWYSGTVLLTKKTLNNIGDQSPFEVFGFRLFDRVMFENSYYFIFARRKTGSFNIRDIDGKNQRDITYKKLKLSRCKRFMVQKEMD